MSSQRTNLCDITKNTYKLIRDSKVPITMDELKAAMPIQNHKRMYEIISILKTLGIVSNENSRIHLKSSHSDQIDEWLEATKFHQKKSKRQKYLSNETSIVKFVKSLLLNQIIIKWHRRDLNQFEIVNPSQIEE